jgi:CheY-like chemotaxis protein
MKRVLVVDDEPTIRELIADFLRESGYHVETAANGAQALKLMRRQLPHAIVLDLMMPELDGNGFVALKRLNARFDPIPVLLVTATFGATEAAERLGAHACLTKPFELDELVNMVERLVNDAAASSPPSANISAMPRTVSVEP